MGTDFATLKNRLTTKEIRNIDFFWVKCYLLRIAPFLIRLENNSLNKPKGIVVLTQLRLLFSLVKNGSKLHQPISSIRELQNRKDNNSRHNHDQNSHINNYARITAIQTEHQFHHIPPFQSAD